MPSTTYTEHLHTRSGPPIQPITIQVRSPAFRRCLCHDSTTARQLLPQAPITFIPHSQGPTGRLYLSPVHRTGSAPNRAPASAHAVKHLNDRNRSGIATPDLVHLPPSQSTLTGYLQQKLKNLKQRNQKRQRTGKPKTQTICRTPIPPHILRANQPFRNGPDEVTHIGASHE
ncbi:hypothetical protein Cflav_PD0434 [Pedosphaera parvula Ellin514]|uniref:Uncharacterized protein n=1 Tax=Pedosphaera parvula (strain Ellin514) TaxID=320771 RepID=B9XRN2_PEDPL|nr:hypothetical protein Cflav_PD0434 [Pedosphaera parvula Ellin514]